MSLHIELKKLEQKYGSNPATQEVYRETIKVLIAFIEGLKASLGDLTRSNQDTKYISKVCAAISGDTSHLPGFLVEAISKAFGACETPEETEQVRSDLKRLLDGVFLS